MFVVQSENDPCPKCGGKLKRDQRTLRENVVDGKVSKQVESFVKCISDKCDFEQGLSMNYRNF